MKGEEGRGGERRGEERRLERKQVQPLTVVTYHRFLRFYPDGHVISFLTTDHPSDVVPLLKPTLRAKGLHFGRWRLIRAEDDKGRKRPRVLVTDLVEPGSDAKYEFEMELGLRETGRGRWNKLDILSYSSINLATGESLGLSLKHQKPFYFSKWVSKWELADGQSAIVQSAVLTQLDLDLRTTQSLSIDHRNVLLGMYSMSRQTGQEAWARRGRGHWRTERGGRPAALLEQVSKPVVEEGVGAVLSLRRRSSSLGVPISRTHDCCQFNFHGMLTEHSRASYPGMSSRRGRCGSATAFFPELLVTSLPILLPFSCLLSSAASASRALADLLDFPLSSVEAVAHFVSLRVGSLRLAVLLVVRRDGGSRSPMSIKPSSS